MSVRSRIVGPAAVAAALASGCFLGDLFSPSNLPNLTVELPADSLLVVGDSVRLTPRALADGQPFTGVRFTFASTRPTVATVDTAGRVAVLTRDTFGIRVTVHSGSLVGEPPSTVARFRGIVARVVANLDSARFASLGATMQFKAVGQRKQGDSIPGVRVVWRSDSAQVVSVDSTGRVTAVRNGGPTNVIVTADGRADTVKVRVRQRTKTLVINPGEAMLPGAGQTAQFTADARDSLGAVNTVSAASWASTAGQVLTVSNTGLATTTGEGIAGVVAQSDGVADTARVVVSQPLLALLVSPDQTTLEALGDQAQLGAAGVNQAGDTVPVPGIVWRSLDQAVATVDTAGVVSAVANGAAGIVGMAGGREDTTTLTVDQVLAGVGIVSPSKDTTFLTSLKDSLQFVAQGLDRNGNAIPATKCCLFTFSSDNPTVATVDPSGLVVAQSNGLAHITVVSDGFAAARAVVLEQAVAGVDVSPDHVSLVQQQTFLLRASAFDQRGFFIQFALPIGWASRNPSVASVPSGPNDTARVVSGTVNDSTYVIATFAAPSGTRSDSALVRVGPLSALCTGGTAHTGTLATNQTWTRAASPHCVGGSFLVEGGATLSIEAGATVKFAAGADLTFGSCCVAGRSGKLRAPGTPSLPITFTALDASPQRGQWVGIRTNWVAANDSLVIRNAVLEYAGGGSGTGTISNQNTCQGTIVLDQVTIRQGRNDGVQTACKLTITGSTIRDHDARGVTSNGSVTRVTNTRIQGNTEGLAIEGTATLADLGGSRITANGVFPLIVPASALAAVQSVPADSLLGNGQDEIRIHSGGDVTTADLFIDHRLPWRIESTVAIGGGRKLTVEAGTTVKLTGQIYIGLGSQGNNIGPARLIADGTTGQIRFTSAQPTPQPGDWLLLRLRQLTDTSILRNVVLEYGGGGPQNMLELSGSPTAPVILDRVTARQSLGDGIYALNIIAQGPIYADSNGGLGMTLSGPNVTITDSRFAGNSASGLWTQAGARKLTIRRSQFLLNGGSGAGLHADSITVDSSLFRRNSNGIEGSTDGQGGGNPQQTTILRSTLDSNTSGGIDLAGSVDPIVQDNLIANNGGTGARVHNGGTVRNNRIRGNRYPLRVNSASVGALTGQNVDSLLGNTGDTLLIGECCGEAFSATDTIRTYARLPWRIDLSDLRLTNNSVWKLEAGAKVFSNGTTIHIGEGASSPGGTLIAQSDGPPIVFTSNSQSPGAWGGLWFEAPADTSRLKNVEVRYAGSSGQSVWLTARAIQPILDSVRIARGAGTGMRVQYSPPIIRRYIAADSNAQDGMVAEGPDLVIPNGSFSGNGGYGFVASTASSDRIQIQGGTFSRNARSGAAFCGDDIQVRNAAFTHNAERGITVEGGPCPTDASVTQTNYIVENVRADSNQDGINFSAGTTFQLRNSRMVGNAGVGLVASGLQQLSGNWITLNGSYPLSLNMGAIAALAGQDQDSLLGNARDTIYIAQCCGWGPEVTATDTLRTRRILPWRLDGTELRLINRSVWKLEPGASVVLNGSRIQIGQNPSCNGATQGAVLRAEGDATGAVRFTSNTRTRGSWSQLLIECLSDTTKLRNVEVSYAGDVGIHVAPGTAGVPVILDSVRVRRTNATGIVLADGAKVIVLRHLAADSNAGIGLHVATPNVTVPAGSFTANTAGIQVDGRRFSLSNADVSLNQQRGILITADSVTIANSRIARNGSTGVQSGGLGQVLSGLSVDTNASHGVFLTNGPTRFTNNQVRGNGGDGISSSSGSAQFFSELSGNTITGNGGYPLILDGASLGPFATQNQAALLGNGRDTLCICSGPGQATVTAGSPTVEPSLPWKNQIFLTIAGGRTLTASAGARLVFEGGGAGLWIGGGPSGGQGQGRLLSLGTAANPVRFVPLDSTSRWHVLAITDQTDTSKLRNTFIEFGGNSGWPAALTIADGAGRPVLLDTVTVRRSTRHGLSLNSDALVTGLRALDNDSSGVLIQGGGNQPIAGSRIERNGQNGIRIDGGSGYSIAGSIIGSNAFGLRNNIGSSFDARNNWWGNSSGPFHSSNLTGTGNGVSDSVNFNPWLVLLPSVP